MSEWKQIIEATKPPAKGTIRLYSFKPAKNGDLVLSRTTHFQRFFGNRECDQFLDIPAPQDLAE